MLLGEFGVVKRTGYSDLTGADLNLHLASRTYFDKYVVDSAHSHGLSPIYWDAGGLGTNTMWLFDRTTAAVIDPDCIHALTGGAALPPPGSGPPPVPTGLAATAGNAQVALTWNASSGATAYDVKRSTVSGSGYATVSSPTTTSYTNTGLTNGTTYYFVVDAKNASGTSANSAQASATPSGSTNLALNKTASADSTQTGHAASSANDGNNTTRWTAANGTLPHWWKVDLGSSHALTKTIVMFEGAAVWKYKIEVSADNVTFTTAVDKTGNTVSAQSYTDTFSATGRYVRITVTGQNAGWWASIFEMQVF